MIETYDYWYGFCLVVTIVWCLYAIYRIWRVGRVIPPLFYPTYAWMPMRIVNSAELVSDLTLAHNLFATDCLGIWTEMG